MADWFAPKRYGYGAGRPIAWQGWALVIAYLALLFGATQLLHDSPWAMASVIVTASCIFIIIVTKTTRGGFRWRWGDKE